MAECPHTHEIGEQQAKISMLEARLKQLEAVARNSADELLSNRVEAMTTRKWLDIFAKIIGYVVLIGVLFAAGKVTGFADLILKIFKI
ncbi:MAG: hypothetical protein K2Q14_06985 [Gammaproteobacteria bacterium]|nr:hypothetical protein [Nitrosomonas sp.]MBY0545272.1 hypothetical protein [Gammaproteobacteria bacterium]